MKLMVARKSPVSPNYRKTTSPSTFRLFVFKNRFMHGLVATLPSLDICMLLHLHDPAIQLV
ncbi:hypothetical protein PHJA_001087200 [Phtheirospermum japonicum]|uniref:Uncharacterized protein n=1 Tax=Phtheirospermum japonicum TaxID=374723 RepID=A0A830BRI7_9LAMI|nr:hypothetical protein PHJA_001087200 [Phtheirospermum japonicum]